MVCLFLSLGNVKSRSKKILKPIDDMNKTVENITIKQIDTRLSVGGTQDELKDLAKTFNGMLDRIQEAYNIQNQFVSDASHELRTPIAVIQGYARLLDRWGKEDKEALEESISAIKSEANNMKELVEKLLFLARGDKNTQPVIMEEFDLNFLVDELLKETKLIDNDHNISCDKNEVVKIYADEKLLKQAFRIFLDNSIKYTPKGGNIGISTYVNGNNVEIVIKDNGIGIDEKDIPKIFDRFYRADESRTRETGGNGLGLSIAKWIIMKHKGKITVNSSLNVGTTIIINLPMNT
ncbi:Signal transduction histidine-protein kinase ArlS [compost metagenome]